MVRNVAPPPTPPPPLARPARPRRGVDAGLLILRLVVGLLFAGHAAQKLFGWFGGKGLAEFVGTVQQIGLHPPAFWAAIEIAAEGLGGLLLVLGLLTPVAAAALVGDMLVAIAKVHWPKGLWSQTGGFEYNLVLVVLLVVLGVVGPGVYALDRRLSFPVPGPLIFAAVLVATLLAISVALVVPL